MITLTGAAPVIEPLALARWLESGQPVQLIGLCHQTGYSLPGALMVSPRSLVAGVPPATGKLPNTDQLQALFSQLGYTGRDQPVVVYDDEGGGWAGRFIWTLDVIGHRNYAYLNGGLHAWLAAGLPLAPPPPLPKPTGVKLSISNGRIATREYIEARLGNPDTVIWDARSPEEYRGDKRLARRGGHIPGAINYEWTRAMDPARGYRIRQGVRQELEALGITGDREIITHCQSHHRSGFTYLVARALGYNRIRAYDGSWSEWGNLPDTPIE